VSAAAVALLDDAVAAGCAVQLQAGLLADLRAPEEQLAARLNPTTRRRIRKAERSGISAAWVPTDEAGAVLRGFAEEAETAFGRAVGAREALAAVARIADLPSTGAAPLLHVVAAHDESGAPISAVVTAESNGLSYYFLSFNSPSGLARDGNPVALWHSMLAARARGSQQFLLGSLEYGEGKSARISAFKRQFGGAPVFAPTAQLTLAPGLEARDRLLTAVVGRLRRM
jgi:hypothetical protein